MKITLVAGKAHNKHTEGGDFREATYRAVRQGLMEAESVLLEPYYSFQLELPEKTVGRSMTDIEKMLGVCEITETDGETAVLVGSAPVAAMRNYQQEVTAYTKGLGRLFCSLMGYGPCHNTEEVVAAIGYDPDRDLANPAGSVFCQNGTGFLVEWFEVKDHMHVESVLQETDNQAGEAAAGYAATSEDRWISLEEIDRIMNRTFFANQGKKSVWKRQIAPSERRYEQAAYTSVKPREPRDEYLLVDGYNIIHAWPELKELTEGNMDGARMKLIESLSNYQAIRNCRIIAVFDAYRVQGHREEVMDYHNIHLVFTKEAQTADQYIEKFAHDNKKKYNIAVATSDGLQQMIVRGAGCSLLSARDLKAEIDEANERIRQEYLEIKGKNRERNYLIDSLSPEVKRQMEELSQKDND
jgi:predicted RNA-binding protein with PIN domain